MSGYWDDNDTGGTAAVLDSTKTWPNHIIAGNYDFVTNGVAWINPSSPDTIPASYYYASKPAYFGNLPWPPIDGPTKTYGEQVIPAGYRYAYGTNPPAGLTPPTGIHVIGQ